MKGITIAICTRNRIDDVRRCVDSISKQVNLCVQLEVLVIDDGSMTMKEQQSIGNTLARHEFRYLKKDEPGLFLSRLEAFKNSTHEVVLFLDDDVEIDHDYLSILVSMYQRYSHVIAIGGVDRYTQYSRKRELFNLISGFGSSSVGKLSFSGYGGSMQKWGRMNEVFESDFLSGCNMSFRKAVMQNIEIVPWFSSYSLGEDLFLSYIASRQGVLLINPNLKVTHHRSPLSRDREERTVFAGVLNHFYMLKYRKSSGVGYIVQLWTATGLMVLDLLHGKKNLAKGRLKGILYILRHIKA